MQLAHSTLGASSMYRWSACPGSVKACADLPNKSSSYADEGTNAHVIAAACLEAEVDAKFQIALLRSEAHLDVLATSETDAMADAVQVYLDHLANTRQAGDIDHIEARFDLSSVHPGCFGTADHVRWRASEGLLIVTDYKHGAGIAVEVWNNPQLHYYALGALLQLSYPARRVRMEIVQPRCEHPDGPIRSMEIDAIELLDFRTDLKNYAVATEQADAPLRPGKHCQFCPAAKTFPPCPALSQKRNEIARHDFSPVLSYDPKQLSEALNSIPAVKAWIKSVDEFAYAEAEAGRCPPGYKLVAKRATRKWVDEEAAGGKLLTVAKNDDLYDYSLKSPSQIEKLIGKKKFADFTDLVVAESSGHKLVPESEPGQPVKAVAKDEFTAIGDAA